MGVPWFLFLPTQEGTKPGPLLGPEKPREPQSRILGTLYPTGRAEPGPGEGCSRPDMMASDGCSAGLLLWPLYPVPIPPNPGLLPQEHHLSIGKKLQEDATSLQRGLPVFWPKKIKWIFYTLISKPLIGQTTHTFVFPVPAEGYRAMLLDM